MRATSRVGWWWAVALCGSALPPAAANALDWSNGQVASVPVKDGRAPTIDGRLDDWDLSAQEPVYIAEQTAAQQNVQWAFMHDDEAFYIAVAASLPGRAYHNPSNPQDAFWNFDLAQIRFTTDPDLPYPLDAHRDAGNPRVVQVNLWKNTDTGIEYLHIGLDFAMSHGQRINPPGSAVRVAENGEASFIIEARVPWAALDAPEGRNPFPPDSQSAFVAEMRWIGGDKARVAMGYRKNPGVFAFLNPDTWGRLTFRATGYGERVRPTRAALLAALAAKKPPLGDPDGVAFEIDIPEDGLKASAAIFGADGAVVREFFGGLPLAKGRHTIRWNGLDAWGKGVEPGEYAWGAYLHRGLRAEFAGTVGASGTPPEPTAFDKSRWGGDQTAPLDCAADETGRYFLWPIAEAGTAVVKTDYEGNTRWRKTPFAGGGFGPFQGMAVDGEFIYLTRGWDAVHLLRLDRRAGALLTWPDGSSERLLYTAENRTVAAKDTALEVPLGPTHFGIHIDYEGGTARHPNAAGLAARGDRVWVGS